jgi:hypothetical protein
VVWGNIPRQLQIEEFERIVVQTVADYTRASTSPPRHTAAAARASAI